jgi:hypothetical protein
MNTTPPGPPFGLIIGGVVLIVVIIVIVLWKTGVFKSKPDAVSSGPGPSPGPMAPGPSPGSGSMSENAMNIKKYYDDNSPVSCPDATTTIAKYMDSIGGIKGVKGSCPEGTLISMKNTNPTDKTSQYDVCIMNQDALQKMMNAPKEVEEAGKNCQPKERPSAVGTCSCPQGYTYMQYHPPKKRCEKFGSSVLDRVQESCTCPQGYTYFSEVGDPEKRCVLLEEATTSEQMVPSPMAPSTQIMAPMK